MDYGGFGQAYFEGHTAADPHPAGYSSYRRDLLPFDAYAQAIRDGLTSQGIDPAGEKVLVVGCAYGYTVEYLIDQWDVDAYGMDVSSHAVSQADSAIAYGDRIYQGDVTDSQALKHVRQQTPGGRFSAVITECVLECLTDGEAQTAAANARSAAQSLAIHRVWTPADGLATAYYNAKTLADWQALCDPNDQDAWYTEGDIQPEHP